LKDKRNELYIRLARFLDDLPGGYPATDSGVELRILKRLYTPEEAELAISLSMIPEEAGEVAKRAGKDVDETAVLLKKMARRGLVYSLEADEKPPKYMATQFVVGVWEYHVNDLDPDLIRDMEEYIPQLLDFDAWKKAPQLRTIPVGESIPVKLEVMPYEKADELLQEHTKLLVAPCICRKERTMVGEGCRKPEESCLVLGRAADYYERNGIGRVIDREEALNILKGANEHGLVLQPSNSQKVTNICCCCGCCCAILRTVKLYPKPAGFVASAFVAEHNQELCTECQACIGRCPMEALTSDGEGIVHDLDRCIGCGLCVPTCPSEALKLVRKPASHQPEVPKTLKRTYMNLMKIRGKLGVKQLVKTTKHFRRRGRHSSHSTFSKPS
jgi:electron transport complex protein RnfB